MSAMARSPWLETLYLKAVQPPPATIRWGRPVRLLVRSALSSLTSSPFSSTQMSAGVLPLGLGEAEEDGEVDAEAEEDADAGADAEGPEPPGVVAVAEADVASVGSGVVSDELGEADGDGEADEDEDALALGVALSSARAAGATDSSASGAMTAVAAAVARARRIFMKTSGVRYASTRGARVGGADEASAVGRGCGRWFCRCDRRRPRRVVRYFTEFLCGLSHIQMRLVYMHSNGLELTLVSEKQPEEAGPPAVPDDVWERFARDSERDIRSSAPKEPSARARLVTERLRQEDAREAERSRRTFRRTPPRPAQPEGWRTGPAWREMDGRAARRRRIVGDPRHPARRRRRGRRDEAVPAAG